MQSQNSEFDADASRGDADLFLLGGAGRGRWAGSRDGEYASRRGGYESVRGGGEAAEGGGEAAEGREGRPVAGEAGMRGTGGGEAKDVGGKERWRRTRVYFIVSVTYLCMYRSIPCTHVHIAFHLLRLFGGLP